jgi:hypothetical protein
VKSRHNRLSVINMHSSTSCLIVKKYAVIPIWILEHNEGCFPNYGIYISLSESLAIIGVPNRILIGNVVKN